MTNSSLSPVHCRHCGKIIHKRADQTRSQYRARKFCGVVCIGEARIAEQSTRFWGRVLKAPQKKCWHWAGGTNRDGYGVVNFGRRKRLAHQVSWVLANGEEIPAGKVVCHSCDTPSCVNPRHLWLGTQADNLRDMFQKGRGKHVVPRDNTGARNPMAKLTAEDVREIRALAGTTTQRKISERFAVGQDQISRILSGAAWADGA